MAEVQIVRGDRVESFPEAPKSTVVSDELSQLLAMLKDRCPSNAIISFDFDGRLHVHIDLRSREDVAVVESLLPALGTGLFHTFSRGSTPNRPFLHRVSALVNR